MDNSKFNGFDDTYMAYTKSIDNFPRISKEEEIELSKIIIGNEAGKDKAIEKLVLSNLRLVLKHAITYYNILSKTEYEMSLMDLISEGNIGLYDAAMTFDSSKSGFSNHATWHIKKKLFAFKMSNRFIRIPTHHHHVLTMVRNLQATGEEVDEESMEKIAKEENTTLSHIKSIINGAKDTIRNFDYYSNEDEEVISVLDNYVDENDEGIGKAIEDNDAREYVLSKMSNLKKMEQEVLFIKFFSNEMLSGEDMQRLWGVSKQRVDQVFTNGLKKLKVLIEKDKDSVNVDVRMIKKMARY